MIPLLRWHSNNTNLDTDRHTDSSIVSNMNHNIGSNMDHNTDITAHSSKIVILMSIIQRMVTVVDMKQRTLTVIAGLRSS